MKPVLLNKKAIRCEPYNDGHWCFAYDPANIELLRELGAGEVIDGRSSGIEADAILARLGDEGLVLAWQLEGDGEVVVDVLVNAKLSSGQKAKAQWLEPQNGFLRVTSGRLRIETFNSLAFSCDEPTDEGCETGLPAGDYDATLLRVHWSLMDDDPEDCPELPTEVLQLAPVKARGPKKKEALLYFGDARGEHDAWLGEGRVDGGTFFGRSRTLPWEQGFVFVNMREAHAQRLGLRFGDTIRLVCDEGERIFPYLARKNRRLVDWFFGEDWQRDALSAPVADLVYWQASTPVVVRVEGSFPPTDALVEITRAEPWFHLELYEDCLEVSTEKVVGRVVSATPRRIVLSFGWDDLRAMKVTWQDVLEIDLDGDVRPMYYDAADPAPCRAAVAAWEEEGETGPLPLLAEDFEHWDEPNRRLITLERAMSGYIEPPDMGHKVAAGPGARVEVRRPT